MQTNDETNLVPCDNLVKYSQDYELRFPNVERGCL